MISTTCSSGLEQQNSEPPPSKKGERERDSTFQLLLSLSNRLHLLRLLHHIKLISNGLENIV